MWGDEGGIDEPAERLMSLPPPDRLGLMNLHNSAAATIVEVNRLIDPELLVEIEAVAMGPGDREGS